MSFGEQYLMHSMAALLLLVYTLPFAAALVNTTAHNASNSTSLYRNSIIPKQSASSMLPSGSSFSDYTRTHKTAAILEIPANTNVTDAQTKQRLGPINNSFSETSTPQASLGAIGPLSNVLRNSSQSGTSLVRNDTLSSSSIDYSTVTDWPALIATTGSGGLYASSCEALSRSWSSVSTQWFFKHRTTTIVTETETWDETTYSSSTAPVVQTSCKGAQRELGGETLAITSLGVTTAYEVYTFPKWTAYSSYPALPPTCTFDVTACNSLFDLHDDYMSKAAPLWPNDEFFNIPPIYYPSCEPDRPGKYCDACTIQADQVQMYYWPPVAIGEPCDPSRRFTTATPTIPGYPNTAVFGTTTFTSPSVYLSFYKLAAVQHKGPERYECGDMFTDIVVAIQPKSVSSIRFDRTDYADYVETFTFEDEETGSTTLYEEPARNFSINAGEPQLVSFGDFMGAVPYEAYMGQMWQAMPPATTEVTDTLYSPHLAVPLQLRTLNPWWAKCGVPLDGVWDPPLPLMPASTLAKPTMPTWATTTSEASIVPETPAPASVHTAPYASPTADQQSQPLSSEAADRPQATGAVGPTVKDPSLAEELPTSAASESNAGIATRLTSLINEMNSVGSRILTLNGVALPVFTSGSVAVIDGQTVTLGGNAARIQGSEVDLVQSGLKIASSATAHFGSMLATPLQPILLLEGDKTMTVIPSGLDVLFGEGIATTVLRPGSALTVSDKVFRALPSGVGVQLDGKNEALFESFPQIVFSVDGQMITASMLEDGSVLLLSDKISATVNPGDGVLVANTTIKALPDGIIVGGSSVVPLTMTVGDTGAGHPTSADQDGRHGVVNGSQTRHDSSTIGNHSSHRNGSGGGDGVDGITFTGVAASRFALLGSAVALCVLGTVVILAL